MKKSLIIIVVLIIVGGFAWYVQKSGQPTVDTNQPVAITPTSFTKVDDKLSQYKNEELGFSVNYPNNWTNEAAPTGVVFTLPTSTLSTGTNSIAKMQVNIDVVPGSCAFPQVTTISERTSTKINGVSFNMVAMSNKVQGRTYFNRMYATPKQSICYVFNLSSIALDPTTNKNYSASQVQAVTAANKEAVAAADAAYKEVIKTFTYVVSPEGENEALHSSTTIK